MWMSLDQNDKIKQIEIIIIVVIQWVPWLDSEFDACTHTDVDTACLLHRTCKSYYCTLNKELMHSCYDILCIMLVKEEGGRFGSLPVV